MAEQLANNAAGQLAAPITALAVSLTLRSGQGGAFPATGTFRIVVDNEIMLVGGRTGDTLTGLTRAAEGTAGTTHAAGAEVAQAVTAGGLAQYVLEQATAAIKPSGIAAGEVPVWNGTGWDRSTVTKIGLSSLTDPGAGKVIGSAGGAAAVFPPGYEVASLIRSVNDGPTGITQTGNGDPLFSFAAATFEAVPYHFELWFYPQSAAGNETAFIRLHDGTAPGALVNEAGFRTPATNPGNPVFVRFRFTPTAGSHTYAVRWRGGSADSYTIVNATTPMLARIVKA